MFYCCTQYPQFRYYSLMSGTRKSILNNIKILKNSMNSLLSGHVCIDYTPNCTNKIAFSTPTLYFYFFIYLSASITCIIFPFFLPLYKCTPPPLPLCLLLPSFWCSEVSLKSRPQVGGDAPVSPPQLRLQPPLPCSILFSRFVVSRKKK